MQHPDEGMIHAWIDGALDSETARELETHIASCEACARLAAEARGLVAASSRILTALDNVPGDVIPAARPAMKPPQRVRPWATPFWMRTAASVLIVVGVSALFITRKLNSPERRHPAILATSTEAAPEEQAAVELDSGVATAPASNVASLPPSVARPRASAAPAAASQTFSAKGASTTASRPKIAAAATAKDASAETADKEQGLADKLAREERVAEAELAQKSLEKKATVAAVPPTEGSRRDAVANAVGDLRAALPGVQQQAGRAVVGGAGSQRAAAPAIAAPTAQSMAASEERLKRIEVGSSNDRVRAATGCYALTISPWSGGTIPFGAPPARIELDSLTSIQESIRGFNLVHPARGAATNGAPLAYWRAIGDSAYITWRDNQRGVTLTFPLSGEVVQGNARTFSTSARDGAAQTAEVEARRISCRE